MAADCKPAVLVHQKSRDRQAILTFRHRFQSPRSYVSRVEKHAIALWREQIMQPE